ncbi:MAG: hypothetical protein OXG78_12305 [Chloroflexi bacterium]|nr:hypothetical protein [Chloroflexota bacterium]
MDAEISTHSEAPALRAADEYRLERLAWFAVVGILLVTDMLQHWLTLHHGLTPLVTGIVFLTWSITRLRRGLGISLSGWVSSALLFATAGYSFFSRPEQDLSLIVVACAATVIALGIFVRDS